MNVFSVLFEPGSAHAGFMGGSDYYMQYKKS